MHIGDSMIESELDGAEGPITFKPFLYILMRTDLESMNPGKSVAQGCHAANQFVHEVEKCRNDIDGTSIQGTPKDVFPEEVENIEMYDYWATRTGDGFGTTICLDVNEDILRRVIATGKNMGMFAGITHDPTYPLRDGEVTHFIPLDTCGFIFGDKDELKILLGQFNLMP